MFKIVCTVRIPKRKLDSKFVVPDTMPGFRKTAQKDGPEKRGPQLTNLRMRTFITRPKAKNRKTVDDPP